MTPDISKPDITTIIQRGLEMEIARIVQEETRMADAQAKANVEKRIREMATNVAAQVLKRFTMETRGQELVIRVNFEP